MADGTCGSTTGMFIGLVQQNYRAKIVTQGGIPNILPTMTPASYNGATVIDPTNLYSAFEALGCKGTLPPRMPTSSGAMQFSNFELYPFLPPNNIYNKSNANYNIPFEWTKVSADFHVYKWDFFDNTIYNDVIPFFSKCAYPWEIKANREACKGDILMGVYGNPCLPNGNFDTSKCVIQTCEIGYYLNLDRTECVSSFSQLSFTNVLIVALVCSIGGCCLIIVCCISILIFCSLLLIIPSRFDRKSSLKRNVLLEDLNYSLMEDAQNQNPGPNNDKL
jgi:hypothetical protein